MDVIEVIYNIHGYRPMLYIFKKLLYLICNVATYCFLYIYFTGLKLWILGITYRREDLFGTDIYIVVIALPVAITEVKLFADPCNLFANIGLCQC